MIEAAASESQEASSSTEVTENINEIETEDTASE